MSLTFRAAAATHVGTVRVNNEDGALAAPALLAVADGMGGHAAGEVASAVVLRALHELLDAVAAGGDGAVGTTAGIAPVLDAGTLLSSLGRARGVLRAMSQADPEMAGMGTTLVGLAVTTEGVLLTHVGDSRLYRLRDGELTQLTTDHTHVQRLVELGRLRPELVRSHPFRSVILRSLDDTSDDLPDVRPTDEIAVGDRLLLCSDGLSDYVPDDALAAALAVGDVTEAADRLVTVALAADTRDNVTALVADVLDGADSPDQEASVQLRLGSILDDAVLTPAAHEAMVAAFEEGVPAGVGPAADRSGADGDGAAAEAEAEAGAGGADVPGSAGLDAPEAAPRFPAPEVGGDEEEGSAVGPSHQADTRHRPRGRDVLWLALVVATFVATTLTVWFTGG